MMPLIPMRDRTKRFSRTTIVPRRRREAGSAILEGALVILPLMAMLFALLDFPFSIFVQNTLRSAVREGVRFAITQQTGGGGQDAAIWNKVIAFSFGFVSQSAITANPSDFTINYYQPDLTAVSGVGSNAGGNIIVVSATIRRAWMAPLWRSTGLLSFQAASSDVMEAAPGGVLPTR